MYIGRELVDVANFTRIFILNYLAIFSGELTDSKLLGLSRRFTTIEEINNLAINGLKMKDYELDRHLESKKYDITAAAHSVLKDWRNSQRNNVTYSLQQFMCCTSTNRNAIFHRRSIDLYC